METGSPSFAHSKCHQQICKFRTRKGDGRHRHRVEARTWNLGKTPDGVHYGMRGRREMVKGMPGCCVLVTKPECTGPSFCLTFTLSVKLIDHHLSCAFCTLRTCWFELVPADGTTRALVATVIAVMSEAPIPLNPSQLNAPAQLWFIALWGEMFIARSCQTVVCIKRTTFCCVRSLDFNLWILSVCINPLWYYCCVIYEKCWLFCMKHICIVSASSKSM